MLESGSSTALVDKKRRAVSLLSRLCRIPLVAFSVWLIACADPCENRVLSALNSPSANKRAVFFELSCRATTGFSTQVSVLNAGDVLPKSAGNVFNADSDHGAVRDMTVMALGSTGSARHSASRTAGVFGKEALANGIAVAYEAVP
jgi:hypothetical protein